MNNKTENQGTITWTRASLARLKKAHAKAVKAGKTEFTFDGHEFVVGYTKYLIQYLDEAYAALAEKIRKIIMKWG